ncbi:MAG TPA: hypothetical protein VND15_00505 [Candidatus Acidoferrales bacterium]|nr:hypothetical protein [Candidatus Acidoferrales bacterium]
MAKSNNNKNRKAVSRPKPVQKRKVVKAAKVVKKAKPVRQKVAIRKSQAKPVQKRKEIKEVGGKSAQEAITQKLKRYEAGEDMAMSRRARSNVSIPDPDLVKKTVEGLMENENAIEYLKKNVSKRSVEVLDMLITPKTDEFLAEKMEMKINAIRRILNIMQGYGITNYYISKNTNGWLSFSWYINTSKLQPFLNYINNMERESAVVNDNCNDYFVCNDCYKTDKLIFTFDAAFENNFKCNCGNSLDRMDSTEVSTMINKKVESVGADTIG